MLDTLNDWIDEFPPLDNPQRFGNKAFRLWAQKLAKVNFHNPCYVRC
jgi:serine/threonine-protein phosphatase 2A activator